MDILSRKSISSFKLCELHFEETQLSKTTTLRKRLLPNAIPTLFPHTEKEHVGEEEHEARQEKTVVPLDVLSEPLIVNLDKEPVTSLTLPDVFLGPSTSKETHIEPLRASEDMSADVKRSSSPLLSPTTSTQTSLWLTSRTPRKEKLRHRIKTLQEQQPVRKSIEAKLDFNIKEFNKLCHVLLDKNLASLVKSHSLLRTRKPLARRYSNEIKQFALTLYFLSPKAYRHLAGLMTLPDKRTLERLTQNLSCKPGLNNSNVFKALEVKLKTMIDQEKHCTLCIDEMSIKSNLFYDTGRDEIIGFEDTGEEKNDNQICKNDLVIMVRGLYSHWKQPVAYFFIGTQFKANKLRPILEECVVKLSEVELKVEGISSDMGSNFVELSKSFGVTRENPEFQIGNQKLLYIFDPCHLIKATRNNFLQHSFSFKEKKTSWSYIQSFYEKDKKQFYRSAPKLTDAHLNPSSFDKMKVKLAVQVFSHSVVVGMSTYMALDALPSTASGTIEVLELFNNLFDICNSFSLNENQKYKKVFEGSVEQVTFLKDTLQFLSEIKVLNNNNRNLTNRVKLINCWSIKINSLLKLRGNLSKCGFKYIITRRLNTDCLENFFGSVRQQGGNCINPTPIQFQRSFRKLFIQNYFHSESMN